MSVHEAVPSVDLYKPRLDPLAYAVKAYTICGFDVDTSREILPSVGSFDGKPPLTTFQFKPEFFAYL